VNTSVTQQNIEIGDQFGTLKQYNISVTQLVAKKLDKVLLRNYALKCRGFLYRNSLKHLNKWSKSFYCLDIHGFTSPKATKRLMAYSMKDIFYQEKIGLLKHLKRIRLGEDVQMLAIPRYNKKVTKDTKKEHPYRTV